MTPATHEEAPPSRCPCGTPLNVWTSCAPGNTADNNIKIAMAWTSYAEAVVTPAA